MSVVLAETTQLGKLFYILITLTEKLYFRIFIHSFIHSFIRTVFSAFYLQQDLATRFVQSKYRMQS